MADFRRNNGTGIHNVCCRFIVLRRKLKLFTRALVAINGSNVVIEVERAGEFVLSAAQLTHHHDSPQSVDVFYDTHQPARRPPLSTQSIEHRA